MTINFDPFFIHPDHDSHSNEVHLITLESSGRVFCPKCLKQQTIGTFNLINDELYQQYIRNLFEALDQRSESPNVRSIILPILEAITTNNSIVAKDEYDYHTILRIVNRVVKSYKFEPNELTLVARVFARISYLQVKSIPLLSCWRVIEQIIKNAKNQIDTRQIGDFQYTAPDSSRFFSSLLIIIQNYLNIFNRYTIDQISEIIFPLSSTDEPILHNKNFYINSQIACLNYVSETILDKCLPHLDSINGPILTNEEKDLATNIFNTLDFCLKTSRQIGAKFDEYLDKIDCINISHKLIYHNTSTEFRNIIRKFLITHVNHNIAKYYKIDTLYYNLVTFDEKIVETSHLNAKAYATFYNKKQKIIFYLLLSSVALKTKSRFFKTERIKEVVQLLNLKSLDITSSRTLMRSICYLIANLSTSMKDCDMENVKNFLIYAWEDIESRGPHKKFNKQFCFDDDIFYWAFECQEFVRMVDWTSIKYILKRSKKEIKLIKNFSRLIHHEFYQNSLKKFLKYDPYASEIIDEIIKLEPVCEEASDGDHERVIDSLSALLPALLSGCILEVMSDLSSQSKEFRIHRMLEMNISMIKGCKRFVINLDYRFISDIFGLMEGVYQDGIERWTNTIILLNEFISIFIATNHPLLMYILKKMNFYILGYAFYNVVNLDSDNRLVQSIASLLLCYNDLDYPLKFRIVDNINVTSKVVIKWMNSNSDELHKLSLEIIEQVVRQERSRTMRASIVTVLMNLIMRKPEFAENYRYSKLYLNIVTLDEYVYNPLRSRIVDNSITNYVPRGRSPPASVISFPDTNRFEEDQIEVSHIIDQMEGGNLFENEYQIPNNLFVSDAVPDELPIINPDIPAWENNAYNTIIISDDEDQ